MHRRILHSRNVRVWCAIIISMCDWVLLFLRIRDLMQRHNIWPIGWYSRNFYNKITSNYSESPQSLALARWRYGSCRQNVNEVVPHIFDNYVILRLASWARSPNMSVCGFVELSQTPGVHHSTGDNQVKNKHSRRNLCNPHEKVTWNLGVCFRECIRLTDHHLMIIISSNIYFVETSDM